jgi:hypothetical protein
MWLLAKSLKNRFVSREATTSDKIWFGNRWSYLQHSHFSAVVEVRYGFEFVGFEVPAQEIINERVMNGRSYTDKLLSLGQVVHKEEGTEEIPALSNLSISKAVVPFKLGNVDNSLASDRILPTKKDINQITAKHKAPRKSSSDVREERDEPLERTMKKQFTWFGKKSSAFSVFI